METALGITFLYNHCSHMFCEKNTILPMNTEEALAKESTFLEASQNPFRKTVELSLRVVKKARLKRHQKKVCTFILSFSTDNKQKQDPPLNVWQFITTMCLCYFHEREQSEKRRKVCDA